MELIYAWIEKFRNFNEVELNFSDRFIIQYEKENGKIVIEPNNSISIYPDYISNINAVVGKNGVGKTNLFDVLGLKHADRHKNNAEFEIKYNKTKGPYTLNDIETIVKHSIYFFIYYLGKDENNQELFCFEGNDIESFQNIIHLDGISPELSYWKGKYWFAFVCNFDDGILIHRYDLNKKPDYNYSELATDGRRFYGNLKSEKDKLAIISFRENLSDIYYDYNSTEPEDDTKISVPRRVATFRSKFLSMGVDMLHRQLQKKRNMFLENEYTLKIFYKNSFLDYENEISLLQNTYNDLEGRESDICKILESFVGYFYNNLKNSENDIDDRKIMELLSEKKAKSITLNSYIKYYYDIVKIISSNYLDKEIGVYVTECFKSFAKQLSKYKKIDFKDNYISLEISKNIKINNLLELISISIDEKEAFNNFFNKYSIENLSDGESAYLGFYASLYEQITRLTPEKEKYIILLDEPETRMHPELTRNFINDLILFLKDLNDGNKMFQIIISTHSPFILSDIPPNNIIYLEKDIMGFSKSVKGKFSTFGGNIHNLLKDGFFMDSTMGEYATNKIKDTISFINKSNVEDVTLEQKDEILYVINSIGEPLIKNRIMKMFNDKFKSDYDYTSLYNENLKIKKQLKKKEKLSKFKNPEEILDTIEILKEQIEKLQTHVLDLEDKYSDKD